jgi:ABC-2 type transport system permease protein
MNLQRIGAIALRVIRQVLRDRRTVALLLLGPMLVLTLGAVLFRADAQNIQLGVVNEDGGMDVPMLGAVNMAERVTDELSALDTVDVISLARAEINDRLKDGTVRAVVMFAEDFSQQAIRQKQAEIDLRLEGSNPSSNTAITALVGQAAMKAMASLASGSTAETKQPVNIQSSYLYGGEAFDMMDTIAPVYIALLAMFFVFLLACVAFLRERAQGTLERLAASPVTHGETVVGYMAGLGLFALIQVAVIVFFTVWVLNIHYNGSLALMILVVTLLALSGVNLGILASAFARTEFQVLQFIPLIILPQALLSGTIWPVADMPSYLRPLAYSMPLYYANNALRDVMIKGWTLAEIWPDVLVLLGFTVVFLALSIVMMRRARV